MIVAGLDLSLTGTGLAVMDADGVRTRLITTRGKKDATVEETVARLHYITSAIELELLGASLVVVESASYGSNTGSQHERAGLWWHVVGDLVTNGAQVATVAPTTLKVYATGKGNRIDKDQVLASVVKRYPWIDVSNNNVADAVVLMAMGLRHKGVPIDHPLPGSHERAMDGAKWPTT